MSDQVTRSMYYYELFALIHDSDNNTVYKDKQHKYIIRFFEMIAKNQDGVTNYGEFLVKTSSGDLFIIIDKVENHDFYFRLVLSRENALPFIEKNGELESLGSYIDNDQNIADITHCIYYGDYGILGAEYNYSGARCTLIPEYIHKIDESGPIVQCHPKFNFDTYGKLIKEKDYTLFNFAVVTSSAAYTDVLASKGIFSALQTTVPESDVMEVCIKKRKCKKSGNKGFELPLSDDEVRLLLENYREDIKKFKVSQGSFCESVDLLSDKFVGKTALIKTEDRTIDSVQMYMAIDNHFYLNVEPYCEKMVKDAS